MHAKWLVEIAAVWAIQYRVPQRYCARLEPTAVAQHWLACRKRFNFWNDLLRRYRDHIESGGASARTKIWAELHPLIEEVLLSEVFTRIFAYSTTQLEQQDSDRESTPVALSILVSHLEIRHRCLQLLVSGKGLPVDSMVSINDLRQYLERWTDLLLSQMGSLDVGSKFCFSQSRLHDYHSERADCSPVQWRETGWKLRTAGVRTWLARNCSSRVAAAAMNRTVADSIVKMSRPEWFDSLGLLKSELIERMYADRPEQLATPETILPGLGTNRHDATKSSDGKRPDSESELLKPRETDERVDFSRFMTRDR